MAISFLRSSWDSGIGVAPISVDGRGRSHQRPRPRLWSEPHRSKRASILGTARSARTAGAAHTDARDDTRDEIECRAAVLIEEMDIAHGGPNLRSMGRFPLK